MSISEWVVIGTFVGGLVASGLAWFYRRHVTQGDRTIQQVADETGEKIEVLREGVDSLEQDLRSVEAAARSGRAELHGKIDKLREDVNENTISKSQFEQFERRFEDLQSEVRDVSQKMDTMPEKVVTLLNRMSS